MNRHLIDTTDLSLEDIEDILNDALEFLDEKPRDILNGKIIINIFFENSTRTRSSFDVAAKRLGAEVVTLDVATSSTSKGETLFDTAANLDMMNPSAIVVRHKNGGVPKILSNYVNCSIINGGDGSHAHPTQALLDLFTIKQSFNDLKNKTIAIVGDIKNSRVANSNIKLLSRFGLNIILVAPPQLLPKTTLDTTHNLKEAISKADIVMSLRTQTERHSSQIYASLKDYASDYCITKDIIKDRNLIILHPGPVHRNVDIDDEVLKDSRCKVLDQVKNGVLIRMAVLKKLLC
ncbi:MAG: aspartate carbamoyltransferase catalytic subunit [Campylobacterales bacterium]|nr:aspartate carbamoyltransferase catalytic subunit [Campylobacterales bacterium]